MNITATVITKGKIVAEVHYGGIDEAIDEISACGWDPSDPELLETAYVVRIASDRGFSPVMAVGTYLLCPDPGIRSARPILRWVETSTGTEQTRWYESEYAEHLTKRETA